MLKVIFIADAFMKKRVSKVLVGKPEGKDV
jgi:hypothetical protein